MDSNLSSNVHSVAQDIIHNILSDTIVNLEEHIALYQEEQLGFDGIDRDDLTGE